MPGPRKNSMVSHNTLAPDSAGRGIGVCRQCLAHMVLRDHRSEFRQSAAEGDLRDAGVAYGTVFHSVGLVVFAW